MTCCFSLVYFFFSPCPRICFLLILERKGDRERNINRLPPTGTRNRDQTCNLGMCPVQGWNPQPFGVWDGAPTNGATRPGLPTRSLNNPSFPPPLATFSSSCMLQPLPSLTSLGLCAVCFCGSLCPGCPCPPPPPDNCTFLMSAHPCLWQRVTPPLIPAALSSPLLRCSPY